jgi:hypothetical protein
MSNLWKAYQYISNDRTKSQDFIDASLSLIIDKCEWYEDYKPHQIVRNCYSKIWRRIHQRSNALKRAGLLAEFNLA